MDSNGVNSTERGTAETDRTEKATSFRQPDRRGYRETFASLTGGM